MVSDNDNISTYLQTSPFLVSSIVFKYLSLQNGILDFRN